MRIVWTPTNEDLPISHTSISASNSGSPLFVASLKMISPFCGRVWEASTYGYDGRVSSLFPHMMSAGGCMYTHSMSAWVRRVNGKGEDKLWGTLGFPQWFGPPQKQKKQKVNTHKTRFWKLELLLVVGHFFCELWMRPCMRK